MTETAKETFEQYDAPWKVVEYEVGAHTNKPDLLKRRFGVENKSGEAVARYITLEAAALLALAPYTLPLIDLIANDSTSDYQRQAQLLLKMKGQMEGKK